MEKTIVQNYYEKMLTIKSKIFRLFQQYNTKKAQAEIDYRNGLLSADLYQKIEKGNILSDFGTILRHYCLTREDISFLKENASFENGELTQDLIKKSIVTKYSVVRDIFNSGFFAAYYENMSTENLMDAVKEFLKMKLLMLGKNETEIELVITKVNSFKREDLLKCLREIFKPNPIYVNWYKKRDAKERVKSSNLFLGIKIDLRELENGIKNVETYNYSIDDISRKYTALVEFLVDFMLKVNPLEVVNLAKRNTPGIHFFGIGNKRAIAREIISIYKKRLKFSECYEWSTAIKSFDAVDQRIISNKSLEKISVDFYSSIIEKIKEELASLKKAYQADKEKVLDSIETVKRSKNVVDYSISQNEDVLKLANDSSDSLVEVDYVLSKTEQEEIFMSINQTVAAIMADSKEMDTIIDPLTLTFKNLGKN